VDGFQWIGIALAALALIGIGYQAFAWVVLGRFFAPQAPAGGGRGEPIDPPDGLGLDMPSPGFSRGDEGVTLLKPLYGAEPRLADNLATFLAQDHAGPVQMVCGIVRPKDPAAAVVASLQAGHPDADIVLVKNPAQLGANGKVGNLINMMPAARHNLLVLSDSDMSVGPDYLATVLAALAQPGVGAASCFYRGRGDTGFWSRLSAGMISHVALPDMVVGYVSGLARPCMGSTIALTRETLAAIGGFERFADTLADDHAIGAAVAERGQRVAIPPMVVTHACTERSFGALWRQKLRWAATVRSLQPWGYAGSVVTRPLPLALLAALFVPYAGLGLALIALLARTAVARRVDRVTGATSAPMWLLPAIDTVEFLVFAASFFARTIDWRGSRLTMGAAGRISA
jgi:ceramide glucosyltransferase